MARRRRKQADSAGWPAALVLLFIIGALIVAAVQAVLHWLEIHWYVVPFLIIATVATTVFLIRGATQRRADKQRRARQLSFSLAEIDAMSPGQFEDACRDLLRRDGLQAERVGRSNDQAVDVKGKDAYGRVIVVQCKHTTVRNKVSVPVLYQVNGTARPVHGATYVAIATNGGFTQPARKFATEHGIRLIDREQLARWAIRETSFHTIAGISAPNLPRT